MFVCLVVTVTAVLVTSLLGLSVPTGLDHLIGELGRSPDT